MQPAPQSHAGASVRGASEGVRIVSQSENAVATTFDNPEQGGPLLRVEGLTVRFPARGGVFNRSRQTEAPAVDNVSFTIGRARTLGLVGESGSGKTTVGRAILRLIPAECGKVVHNGVDILSLAPREMMRRRREMQMVFQDPAGSLDPRMRVGDAVAEPLRIHRVWRDGREEAERVASLLVRCGMPPDAAERYPHEFSGGQRQRIAIARALALGPGLLICDEPTSALDVSVQAQILNLLKDLQRDLGLSCLFISHDMAVVQHMCDEVAVMRGGRIVEMGSREEVIERPQHEYTRSLLASVLEIRTGRHTGDDDPSEGQGVTPRRQGGAA